MSGPIDELVTRWRDNPSPTMTVALCDALRTGGSVELVQQVGRFATQRHASEPAVLISVARMYIESSRFAEAQTVLVAAGKQAPRDADVYRWLGETLLRRGDAERAEKVLERAMQLGSKGPDAKVWLERARAFRPMQAKAGTRAVAAEVAHTAQPAREILDSISENTTDVHVARPQFREAGSLPTFGNGDAPRFPRDTETAPASFETPAPPPPRVSVLPKASAPPRAASAPPSALQPLLAKAQPSFVYQPALDSDDDTAVQMPLPTSPLPNVPGPFGGASSRSAPPVASRNGAARDVSARPPATVAMINGAPVPATRDVLEALAFAGIYEPQHAGASRAIVWDKAAAGPKRRGSLALVLGMVLFVGAGTGTYFAYRDKRAKDHVRSDTILATVEDELRAGKPDALAGAEKELAQALGLESRSPRAALDWTRERAAVGLLKGGEDVAFEDSMARAKDVGVPEEKYAFARVASFLFQGDTAGAAAVLPHWDGPATSDAWYQLVAGATLERAGDPRARDRYAAAVKLDAGFVPAQVALARVTAFAGDATETMRLAKALQAQLPDRAEPIALVALAWSRDPRREDNPVPPEVDKVAARADELPSGLRFAPHAVAALRALDKHAVDDARSSIEKGLAVSNSPGAAVWLGSIAIELGDEGLARKAALNALQLSAAYEPARALAARVALLGGRLDEALKATEDLDPTSTDAAVVRAAAAYERVDPDGAARGLEALTPASRKLPVVAALAMASDAMAGRLPVDGAKLLALSDDEDTPWSDLVAIDVALNGGDLPTADKIAAAWGKVAESQALRALRLARLARYEGRLEAADALSQTALASGTVTPRVLWERVFTLVARNRANEVGPLLARYPLVLGPLATWLSAYAAASGGNVDAAKGRTASLDPPPATAPFEARVVAAAALGAMKDKRRGGDYVKEALATGNQHPDLVAAALALGFHRVDHGKRRPTYE